MSLELLVPALFSLFFGICSLYIDPKEHKIGRGVLLVALILSGGTSLFFGYHKDRAEERNNDTIKQLNNSVSKLTQQNSELLQIISKMGSKLDEVLRGLGWSQENLRNPIPSQINQSLQASQVLNSVDSGTSQRQSITVQYFPKNVDPTIVRSRLEALGFNVNLVNPKSQLQNTPTNAIWFGSKVDIDSVKAVAYTLIGAGVQLKAIRQFNNSQGREQVIQVGGDVECVDRPALTVKQIQNIQRFPRQDEVVRCQVVL